ncbi:MAG: S-layer homology domain-containing protein [Thermoleophilia bacterium]
MANRGGFSWKRALGVTKQKRGGCLLWILVLPAVVVFLGTFASTALAFTDVPTGHVYGQAIEDLSTRSIINGFPDGTFRPDRVATRQQFAKMVALTFAISVTEADVCPFSDVQIGGYPDPFFPDNYIAACATNEITKGTSPTTFSPWDPIKRAQLLTMVVRAANRLRPDMLAPPPGGYAGSLPNFVDLDHAANLRTAEYNGLLAGLVDFGAAWDPWAPATRGEVAQVLHNLLERPEPVEVLSVIDGDTIQVRYRGHDESIRLIGLDTPESGEPFSHEASIALADMLQGQEITLEFDVEPRDIYGRLLAYVWLFDGDVHWMANETMLLLGLATLYTVPPNVKYVERFQQAQTLAQVQGAGIWGEATQSPLEIASIHADAAGNDTYNLNDEWIEFRVIVSGALAGYAVEDQAGHHYDLPDRVFTAGQVFKLHSGAGADTQTDLYWGMSGSAVWNNDGDTVKVLDGRGHVLLSQTY